MAVVGIPGAGGRYDPAQIAQKGTAPETAPARERAEGMAAGPEESIPAFPQETPAVTRGSFSLPEEKDETISMIERMLEAQKKAKEQKDRFKIPKNTQYGEYPMEAYARLARARTQSQVGAAAGYARRQIAQLRAEKRQADSVEGPRIQAAINQLEKAVTRAGKKKRDLQREQLTEARQKRLEAKRELGKARALRAELRKQQQLRRIRERGYLKEAEIDDRYQQEMAATRAEYQAQLQNFAGTVPGTPGAAAVAGDMAATAGAVDGGAAVAAAPVGGELNITA